MKLDELQKNAIDNYGDEISTLKDFVTAVRTRPGMYLGPIGNLGLLNMIREVFQNSVDQLIDPTSPCNRIHVSYNMKTLEVIVEDNGKGLPFDLMIKILTTPHTSKNYKKKKGEYSSGLNGVGCKVVNALSSYFKAISYKYDGTAASIEMIEGYPSTDKPLDTPNPDKRQGTYIKFIPSLEYLVEKSIGVLNLDGGIVYNLIKRIISLTPIGSTVDYEWVDLNGELHGESIINQDGILTDLIIKAPNPFIKPITFFADNGELRFEGAIVYSVPKNSSPDQFAEITSFCNFCPTEKGTHIKGFLTGIESWFVSYMNKIFLSAKNNKTKVISADIDCGLKVMISAACLEPIFTGQAKEILSNAEMEPFAKSVAKSTLDEWSKSNPQDLNKVCKYLKEIADIRMKSDNEKSKITDKFTKNFTGYPAKYAPPEGKTNLEFIICEGDSAKGTIMDGRDIKRQGVFPIRGKMPNAYRTSKAEFMANTEVQGINKIILDGPYRRNYDPIKDVKWEKIIFAADADIDGAHINAILLRYFLLYHPQLIEAGKVYKTIPPLFGVTVSKNKTAYFTERLDIVRYIQKEFAKSNTVCNADGSSISTRDLSVLLARNIDYTNEVDKIAHTYAVDPCLLEMVLVADVNKKSPAFLRKQIKSKYRFVTLEEKDDNILIEGAINGELYDTLFVTPQLIEECKNIIDILDQNTELFYKLNGEDVSLYTLMSTFENSSPKTIQRYKGLGEMNYKKLAESTIHPDGQRTLVQYTLEDAKEEIEAIRVYESNMKLILNEVGKVTRTELLG